MSQLIRPHLFPQFLLFSRILPGSTASRRNTSITIFGMKTALNIKWQKPDYVAPFVSPKCGDLEPLKRMDKSEIVLDFRCESLNNINKKDIVRRLFTLEFNSKQKENALYVKELEDRVRRHAYDTESVEVQIAKMTAHLRIMQDHQKEHPLDRKIRVRLRETVAKRNKWLRMLRKWDYKRFEWILDKLQVEYHPPPKVPEKVERKKSVRKLTDMHCKNITEAELAGYKKHLETEKVLFYEDKLKKLRWIKENEKRYNLEETVLDEDINACVKKLEELKLTEDARLSKNYVRKVDPNTLELYEP